MTTLKCTCGRGKHHKHADCPLAVPGPIEANPTHEENTMLTTQRVVLARLGLPEEHVENFIPGDGETIPNVTLRKEDWEDMGSPEHITVVIEPGANL